nr:hypothetical protein [Tanacetum cinerariifolium]
MKSPSYSLSPINLSKLLMILLIFSHLSIAWIIVAVLSLSLFLHIDGGRYFIRIPLRRSSRAVRTSVTELAAENEHLKQTYKQLYDSIKSSRVRSKEQYDELINKVNLKSAEVSDLNASLQEKVLVITALKEQLNKLKGKPVLTEAVSLNPIDRELLKVDVTQLVPKLR